ncbi:hypothetical protein I6G97_00725 [Edwardsiella hoshinae]|uniref:Uncharacterized protein n=1 Tax=Edwardsiella hoshinae TaxID=93378 RepID=A0A376D7U0_9GAMM|nr:hypothetical protein [Edwardsiella hoshinae]QPR28219.1 hypothetical protein I6G97_00725 [Edwardsiella hoshinae]STC84356.1 Uncharacterised protein [Edwardsiella hoshinae]
MKASEFNKQYPIGSVFIYQPNRVLRGGRVVRTVDKARDLPTSTAVEINVEPYFVNVNSLIHTH